MEPLRMGVIGVGGMGGAHCRAAAEIKEIDLKAGADVSPENRNAFAEQYELPCYADHRELLERDDIDAVSVAAPHVFHRRLCEDAFAAGKHVYCEKPLAVTVRECDAIVRAADAAGKKLGVVFQRRMAPLNREIARRIHDGELGELIRANMIFASLRTQEYFRKGARWRGTWKGEGGGVLLNQAPHPIDLYQWFVGMPSRVTALTSRRFHDIETEDQASALFEHPNGAHGFLTVSTVDFTRRTFFEIVGTKGSILLDGAAHLLTPNHPVDVFIRESNAEWGKLETVEEELRVEGENTGHGGQLRDFALAVLQDRDPAVTGREGAKTVEIFNAIILSAETKQTIELPVDRDAYDELLRRKIESKS